MIERKWEEKNTDKTTTLKRGFAYSFGWLFAFILFRFFLGSIQTIFLFFGSSLCRCQEPKNGRQTRLEIFARHSHRELKEEGDCERGEHVKEQLLKRIYRFIFVCAMWVDARRERNEDTLVCWPKKQRIEMRSNERINREGVSEVARIKHISMRRFRFWNSNSNKFSNDLADNAKRLLSESSVWNPFCGICIAKRRLELKWHSAVKELK